jgi:hypothetical protein
MARCYPALCLGVASPVKIRDTTVASGSHDGCIAQLSVWCLRRLRTASPRGSVFGVFLAGSVCSTKAETCSFGHVRDHPLRSCGSRTTSRTAARTPTCSLLINGSTHESVWYERCQRRTNLAARIGAAMRGPDRRERTICMLERCKRSTQLHVVHLTATSARCSLAWNRWDGDSELRAQVRYLLKRAEYYVNGGYLELLETARNRSRR